MQTMFLFGVITICVFGVIVNGDGVPECYRRNEEFKCVPACPPERTCKNKDIKFRCLETNEKCQMRCKCKEGFYRNFVGDCITKELCDMCPGAHEYYSCSSFCDNVCSELHIQNKTHCPIVNIRCNDKCYCEDEYARNEDNECIPISQCQKLNLEKFLI